MVVKSGNRILLGKWPGLEIEIDGKGLLIIKMSYIFNVIEQVRNQRRNLSLMKPRFCCATPSSASRNSKTKQTRSISKARLIDYA